MSHVPCGPDRWWIPSQMPFQVENTRTLKINQQIPHRTSEDICCWPWGETGLLFSFIGPAHFPKMKSEPADGCLCPRELVSLWGASRELGSGSYPCEASPSSPILVFLVAILCPATSARDIQDFVPPFSIPPSPRPRTTPDWAETCHPYFRDLWLKSPESHAPCPT